MEYIAKIFVMAIAAIFIQNFVLARFLGLCSYIGVSKKLDAALGMGMAVVFVMTLTSSICYILQYYVLKPFHLEYLQTVAFILTIAALVQFVEMVIKKSVPSLYKALGVYLPLITTNCAVLAVAIINIQATWPDGRSYSFIDSTLNGVFSGLGYTFVLLLMAGIRERLETADIPVDMKGMPIALIIAGCMALAFLGFSGLKLG